MSHGTPPTAPPLPAPHPSPLSLLTSTTATPAQTDRTRKKDAAESLERRKVEERRRAEAEERSQRANEKAFHDLMPAVQRWAAGEGEVSEIKRFGRRPELRLLTLMPSEMKHKVSSFQWTQYMTSGLQRIEVRAIAHKLRDRDVPHLPTRSAPS